MAFKRALVSNGLSVHQAASILGVSNRGVAAAQTAAGTTRADALAIVDAVVNFGTVASGTGALLPYMEPGDEVWVRNGGANALLAYPYRATEIINALSAGAGYSIAAGKSVLIKKIDDLHFATLIAA